jgi:DNA-binding LacI/PurR family transcriptional regulator
MSGKLKIKEVAAQTGVSISTVSRVLAGKANTSAEVKQKVLDCAKSHGVLSAMSAGRLLFNNVTVFAPPRAFDVRTDIFYSKGVQGIRSAVEPEGNPHKLLCDRGKRLRHPALPEKNQRSGV